MREASSWRERVVTAARNWLFVLVNTLGFVLVKVLFLVGGFTVDCVE